MKQHITSASEDGNKIITMAVIRRVMKSNCTLTFGNVEAALYEENVMSVLIEERPHWTRTERRRAYLAACTEMGAK